MIIFEEPRTVPRAIAKPHPDAIRRGLLGSYGDESFGYILKADLKNIGTYRYIRLEEGAKSKLSGLYGSKSQALEAIFLDSQRDGRFALKNPKTKPWVGDLLRDIRAEDYFREDSPRGKAAIHFGNRAVLIYGDAEYGHVIIRSRLGGYRAVCFDGTKRKSSKSFATELQAVESAYESSLLSGWDTLFKSWFSELAIALVSRGTSNTTAIDFVGDFTFDFVAFVG